MGRLLRLEDCAGWSAAAGGCQRCCRASLSGSHSPSNPFAALRSGARRPGSGAIGISTVNRSEGRSSRLSWLAAAAKASSAVVRGGSRMLPRAFSMLSGTLTKALRSKSRLKRPSSL